jgi:transcriptional regulator with XRE-family HTH domain
MGNSPKKDRPEIARDPARGARIQAARESLEERSGEKWPQARVASRMGVDVGTYSRWERGYPIKPRDVVALAVVFGVSPEAIDPDAAKALGENVPRGTAGRAGDSERGSSPGGPPAEKLPFAFVLRRPAVRARLNAIQRQLIEAGAAPEVEESVMRAVQDRQRIARFAGGSVDDSYTEAEVLQVIDNIAETAIGILGLDRPSKLSDPLPVSDGPELTHEKLEDGEILKHRRNAHTNREDGSRRRRAK